MSIDFDMQEIVDIFVEESLDGLETMESELLNLKPGAADPETMNSIFRAAHSIKGGAATVGFTDISEFAHICETLMDQMRQGDRDVTQEAVDLLLKSGDCLRDMIKGVQEGNLDLTRAKELEGELNEMLGSEPAETQASGAAESVAESGEALWQIDFKPQPTIFKSCNDPQRMFRELAELGELTVEVSGVDQLDFAKMDASECLLAWHLELRAKDVTKEQIEEAFAWVSDECELVVQAEEAPAVAAASDDAPTEKTPAAAAKKPPVPPSAPQKSTASKEGGSIRVNIDKVDGLINLVGELVITQSMLSRFQGEFDFTMIEQLRDGLTQLARNTRELQESVIAIRMLPISVAFSRFPRLVRDTGNALNKKVELRLTGEGTELDKTVLEKIGDPLVHLVRNSLDHGLESPEDRLKAGKPETGLLELKAYHEGGNIVIEVIDDGAGINKEKVLAKARERGLVGEDEQLSDDKINNLIFMAGFSTADQVSDLSGRGVGMDVVKRNIADLGGHVSVKSEEGKGSKFVIYLPLTLAILDGQLVRVGTESYIISLVSIVETIRVKKDEVNKVAGRAEMFKLRDQYLPVLRLHELFGLNADSENIEDGLLVVAEAGGQRVGILVDDLLDQQQVVIKSLEANYRQMPGISGATILGDGHVALIIDVPGLIQLFLDSNAASRVA